MTLQFTNELRDSVETIERRCKKRLLQTLYCLRLNELEAGLLMSQVDLRRLKEFSV
jgi:hypothetical protein